MDDQHIYRSIDGLAVAIRETLISPNEADRNLEAANVVDGLFYIGRAIMELAKAVKDSR